MRFEIEALAAFSVGAARALAAKAGTAGRT
jgi:hypothetical protein